MHNKLFINNSTPIMGKITKIKEENETSRTFNIALPHIDSKVMPGQFVMVWIPGYDEFPIGVAGYNDNILELCVTKVGEGTTQLFKLKEGDQVGIRGIYGKGFRPDPSVSHIIVGGGFGMPPLKFLINELLQKDSKSIIVFEGARKKELLLYVDYLEKLEKEGKITFNPYTDDGSYGKEGFPTEGVKNFLANKNDEKFIIYSAGPEKMMKALFDLGLTFSSVVDMQMSLADRHMRCGFGLCGACVVDPLGLRICVDGPVFSTEQLSQISDFGKYSRGPTGKKEKM